MVFGAKRCSLLLAAAAVAALAGSARAEETGLSGLWLLTHGQFGKPDTPPLTPEAKAAADEARKTAVVMNKQRCLPVGMPRFLTNELPFEIIESPERIGIIGEQAELARTIYMNTDKFADDIMPTWNGNAYGKWENGVLVVHTGVFNDRVAHIPGTAKGSTTTTITEKYRVVDGGKGLVVEMTFEDPKLLTKPWTVSYHYDRQPQGAQRWEYICDVDDPLWNTALGVPPQK
ncbi:MAG: hypothetical protein ABIO39_02685 [Caulobacteraceae bacterium]